MGSTVGFSGFANLTVTSSGGLQASFDTGTIKGGNALQLTLTVSSPAPAGGLVYTLTSSDPAIAPPATMTIPAGAKTASLGIPTNAVLADLLVSVTAAKDGVSKIASATVQAPQVKSANAALASVVGNTSVVVVVLLDGPAPAGMNLAASSNSTFATIPATIPVPTGQAYVLATVTAKKSPLKRLVTITLAGKLVKLTLLPSP
jgi:hypothetical protein